MSGKRWSSGKGSSLTAIAHGQMPPTWVVIVVGLGILLALVGATTVPRILDSRSGERYATLIDSAQQRIATSRVQQDPGEKRKVLTEAQAMLLEAQSLNGNAPDAQQLLSEVKGAISQMDNIKAPSSVEQIASLEQFGDKPITVARLTAGLDEVYILDSTSGQVISVSISTGAKTVVFGEDKELRRGRPLATTYLEATDQGPVLVIADAARNLWAYNAASGIRPLLFAAPANLAVTDITTSGRDLYVLDANQKTVFRFNQSDGGYASIPFKALESPSLEKARRLVVSGNEILTADEDGTIHRFLSGASLQLSEAGIDKRLVSAEPPLPLTRNKSGDISELAVLDASNNRIVVFRGDGSYDRQYQHKDFTGISALAIRNSTAFVFSGGKLRRVTW